MVDISHLIKNLVISHPFYGTFLLTLNRVFVKDDDPNIQTCAVGINGINLFLYINNKFMNGLTIPQQRAILLHEVMHCAFFHLDHRTKFPNHDIANIAMDIEINQYIDEMPGNSIELPHNCLHLDSYEPKLVLPPHAGSKTYYDLLKDHAQKNPNGKLAAQLIAMAAGKGKLHGTWKDYDKLSDEEKQLAKSQVDSQLKQTAEQVASQNAGNIPGELKVKIDSLFHVEPPIFDWKSYFRRFLGFSDEAFTRQTRYKENVKFPGSAAIKIRFKQNVLVMIDTSGSVSDDDLKDFFSEINHIHKAGVGVHILEFDHGIQRDYKYNGKWDGSISGRGGTEFTEAVNWYNDRRNKFTSAVLFTDGYAPLTDVRPLQKMLWVITHDGDHKQKYPGFSIFIPNKKHKK